ncbi:uncharacterized protein LOC129890502 [Solanum dulcamara]|uniref:uncharacterized protein LOC129890502 n=1 Tax=Solanum dulcamara TaxID=45834 RepID=UPI002485CD3E|nr:uncharacterized protein LOC129890502 [Solanum dulcamara]
MIYAKQIEREKLKERNIRESKRAQIKVVFVTPNSVVEMVPNPKAQGRASGGQGFPPCKKCGKNHRGECLDGLDVCFKYGNPNHHVIECRGGARTQGQTQATNHSDQHATTSGGGQHQKIFYALQTCQELEDFPNIVIDPGANLLFVTSYLAMRFINDFESSFMEDVKSKQDSDPTLVESKKEVAEKAIEAFS